jgi:hypothetical protein
MTVPEGGAEPVVKLDPALILVGLGQAQRKAVASLLALFSDASLPKLFADQLSDVAKSIPGIRSKAEQGFEHAFSARIEKTSRELDDSAATTDELRLRTWMHLRNALSLKPDLTFAPRGMGEITGDMYVVKAFRIRHGLC